MTNLVELGYATCFQAAQVTQAIEKVRAETRWAPVSAEERELVARELEAIVSSYHFKGSRRYPALLKYVVEAALDERSGDLKERTLGVEVFGRDPSYDTNADPVVRISAAEVRKRIAQFYHENGQQSRVQIELPLGSYAPEFLLHEPGAEMEPAAKAAQHGARARQHSVRAALIALAAVLLVAGGITAYLRYEASASGEVAARNLWNPLLNSGRPVLIVLGTTHPSNMQPPSADTTFGEHNTNPYHHVSVSTAMALAHLVGALEKHKKSYEVKEAPETSLTDIRSRPIILVGAINNQWTMRLTGSLRYHFTFTANEEGAGVDSIDDAASLRPTGWTLDSSQPYLSVSTDYAIVARFRDPTTEGPVMVIAGVGPYGTEAASEFVGSPEHLAELAAKLPRDWQNRNLEVVIKTKVIGANAGPPVLVSAFTW